jgi:hypothetical protein
MTCCRDHCGKENGAKAFASHGWLWNPFVMPFMACIECSNKRCPKATNCDLECTGSNDAGQSGSAYVANAHGAMCGCVERESPSKTKSNEVTEEDMCNYHLQILHRQFIASCQPLFERLAKIEARK